MDRASRGAELPVVVVGAGAAGTVAAIFAAKAGRRFLLLESTPDGGRKILVSGGGRCNILPSDLDPTRYVTDSSRTIVSSQGPAITGRQRKRHYPL